MLINMDHQLHLFIGILWDGDIVSNRFLKNF